MKAEGSSEHRIYRLLRDTVWMTMSIDILSLHVRLWRARFLK